MPRAKITKVIVDEYVAGFQIGRPPQTKTAYLAQDLVQGYRDWFRQPDAMIIARSFDQPHSETISGKESFFSVPFRDWVLKSKDKTGLVYRVGEEEIIFSNRIASKGELRSSVLEDLVSHNPNMIFSQAVFSSRQKVKSLISMGLAGCMGDVEDNAQENEIKESIHKVIFETLNEKLNLDEFHQVTEEDERKVVLAVHDALRKHCLFEEKIDKVESDLEELKQYERKHLNPEDKKAKAIQSFSSNTRARISLLREGNKRAFAGFEHANSESIQTWLCCIAQKVINSGGLPTLLLH
ncbi:hypothetical protein Psal099_03533 (plasmid) [Piscirickettsia salmonis]|uniref:hypothetical protein n=1 Tax=Piscirickettsia salmonis TaxID=1238 RepID=UPI0012B8716B|nr:hypothetical protein [Piscirickettsia salmonis]QGO75467.1 hypothetical protein Psal098_03502 [Piscirickettsia salmonis]QGO78984.1 hypothetical protein Psal099_03533 [Piscirickettsia salmonis]